MEFTRNTFCTTGTVSCRLPELQDSGNASSPRAAVAGGAWKIAEAGGSGSASSPLPFPTSGDTHRHLQKKKNTCSQFYLGLFSFPDMFLVLLFLRSLSLLFSHFLSPLDFGWMQNWRLWKDCWRPELWVQPCMGDGFVVCCWRLACGQMWTTLMADGVDGADGSVGMLLDGLHSCRW